MSPEYVRPYVKAQKNDDRDAEGDRGSGDASDELKSQDQLDMQPLHRSRDRLVGERTALINQLRAILLERGMVAPQGKRKLEQFLIVSHGRARRSRLEPAHDCARRRRLARNGPNSTCEIGAFDAEFVRWAKEQKEARRLTATIPGIGAIVASALVAAVGQAESFERGRDLACLAGSGSATVHHRRQAEALGTSKRGNKYLRRRVDPWRARRAAPCGGARHAARSMGERAPEPRSSQCRGRRLRQQAGQDRLGGAAARRKVCRYGNADGGVESWSIRARGR